MAVIALLSSAQWSASNTGGFLALWLSPWLTTAQIVTLNGIVRKTAHLTEYAILGALWYRAFVRGQGLRPGASAWIALVISVAWAVVDEVHQSFVPTRTASPVDVLFDITGAGLAVAAARLGLGPLMDRGAGLLLWFAAVGGALVIGVNALNGVSSRYLWVTVPAAALVLLVRWRNSD
jgi:VanZ family protein